MQSPRALPVAGMGTRSGRRGRYSPAVPPCQAIFLSLSILTADGVTALNRPARPPHFLDNVRQARPPLLRRQRPRRALQAHRCRRRPRDRCRRGTYTTCMGRKCNWHPFCQDPSSFSPTRPPPPINNPPNHQYPFQANGASAADKLKAGKMESEHTKAATEMGMDGCGLPIVVHGDLKINQSFACQEYFAQLGPVSGVLSMTPDSGFLALILHWDPTARITRRSTPRRRPSTACSRAPWRTSWASLLVSS